MVAYKDPKYFQQSAGVAFDYIYEPGTATPYSGIYGCAACGLEVVSTHLHPLPPQNHHQHRAGIGPVRWHLRAAVHAI